MSEHKSFVRNGVSAIRITESLAAISHSDEYFKNGFPRVVLLIHFQGKVLLVKEKGRQVLPHAELVRGERLFAGMHRALITMVGFQRTEIRAFSIERCEVHSIAQVGAPNLFLVECFLPDTVDFSPKISGYTWSRPRCIWGSEIEKFLSHFMEKTLLEAA